MRRSRRNAGPAAEVVRNICPGPAGAKDWNPSAFSPVTGLLYIPTLNICMDMGVVNANDVPGTPFVGADVRMYAGSGGNRGAFIAWDPVARRKVFEIREDLPLWSPALATAGGLVFYGTMKAIDARTGKLLWRFKTASGIIGQQVSYRGPDGRQYVAVPSGIGGRAGAIVSADLDPRDRTAALGFAGADMAAGRPRPDAFGPGAQGLGQRPGGYDVQHAAPDPGGARADPAERRPAMIARGAQAQQHAREVSSSVSGTPSM